MAFGKSTDVKRRHRPKKVEEVDEDEVREKREDQLNTQKIPLIVSIVGSVAMLGIVVMGAPYSYGSQRIHYSGDLMRQARNLADASKQERAKADPRVLVDFTKIIIQPGRAETEAMKKVAVACRQGRGSSLTQVTPNEIHRGFEKSTKFLNCAMVTESSRFCSADERQTLVGQLMDYKEKRQTVIAFEKYRDNTVTAYNEFRESQREAGVKVAKPLDMTDKKMDPDFDAAVLRNIEVLVKNGYLSPSDFGYYGLYVPAEYSDALRVGADRYAPCQTRT